MLTAADLSYMQATQDDALPGTVVIERTTQTPDGMGGVWDTWAAVGTVIGRIYPRERRGTGEMVTGAQIVSQAEWYATFPVGTNITAKDRLVYDGRTWEVREVNNSEMWQTAVRCELEAYNQERRV